MPAPDLILASNSPRRRELLSSAGLSFEVVPPRLDEARLRGEPPPELVVRLAREKAAAVRTLRPEAVVLAADTVVALGDRVLGKPSTAADAAAMLRTLAGQTHEVLSGVAIVGPTAAEAFFVRTSVRFRPLLPGEIDRYVASGEPMDKAGAYGIQGGAAGFVESIAGSYTNVVGLPLAQTLAALRRHGVAAG